MVSRLADARITWGILLSMALGASFVFCYWGTFMWLNYKYQGGASYYSHGYLVPVVSAYLVYRLRARLSAVPPSSSAAGLFIVAAALVVHVFGVLGNVNFVSAFSLVFYLIGCALYFLGREAARIIAFPLMFLFFMCPLPDAYLDAAAWPLKSSHL